jgi:hypothetical protein
MGAADFDPPANKLAALFDTFAVSDKGIHVPRNLRHRRKPPDSDSAYKVQKSENRGSPSDTANVPDLADLSAKCGPGQLDIILRNWVVFNSDPGKTSSKLRAPRVLYAASPRTWRKSVVIARSRF